MTVDGSRIVRERMAWERDFTQVPNSYARDRDLSWVARGILVWLMSHDAGYQVSMATIEQASWKEGREAVRSAVAELEKAGYLHRQRQRGQGGRLAGYLFHLQDPHQLSTIGREQLPIPAVDNSRSTSDGNPSDGSTYGRVAVDGKPSVYKNTKVRTHKDPALVTSPKPSAVDKSQRPAGSCGHPLVDARHCELGCSPSRVGGAA